MRKLLALLVGGWSLSAVAELTPQDTVFFETKVQPVLSARCYECHSHEKKIKGGLTLDSRSGWEQGGETGPAIVPGKPESSLLIEAISHRDKELAMPPKNKLSESEIAILTEWVKRGAPDPRLTAKKTGADLEEGRKHWAFQPIANPPVPASAFPQISQSPIDAFLFAPMPKQGLQPAPLAARATLLRRATYDLTGLPPTADELTAFANDPRPEEPALAAAIDRLLASPSYGEKWGRFWLDLAHYADTTGCSSDWPIDDLWRYRDWVIAAFNEDKPFDRFLTEQLAGDLLAADMLDQPGPLDEKLYRERIVATGFLATAKRFGSDPGGYQYLTIGDTLDTTWKALQGLTLGCARCHDHKFDPVLSSDYYALYGIFASSLYPYSGAEKNQNAELLVPLDRPEQCEPILDAWNRELPIPGAEKRHRSVLSSSSNRWGFEDHETSEKVADRPPVSPWVCQGGIAVRDGNSPFTHLLPAGIKLVEFQATASVGEMSRRVRWSDESSLTRSVALDLQLTNLWDANTHSLSLAWRPLNDPSKTVELPTVSGNTLTAPGLPTAIALPKGRWHHLALTYSLDSATLTLRLWDENSTLLTDLRLPSETAAKLRPAGDLVLRFETTKLIDKREACVRVDNIVAESRPLPTPQPAPPALPTTDADRALTYKTVLPRKPETAFAMWEGTPHDEPLQKRGEPEHPGPLVPRRNLLLLGGQTVTQPRQESGRRDLARWLVDDSNPLTHRVFVNRLWQWHFGRGLVASPSDFGHKGEPPTHPELLDYLVQRFRTHGLSIKAMHREIMLSHAYRQSSAPVGDSLQRDPENRWLTRFSPRRLTAEEVRDSVLRVAGQLDAAGAGYRQPFPPLNERGWTQHSPFSLGYERSYAAYEHRKRSIYLPVVRLVADPFLSTFDGADSNQSIAARGETSVPLQALALLNAPFVVEAANALGNSASQSPDDPQAVALLHRRIFGTEPSDATSHKLTSHLTRLLREPSLPRPAALAAIAQSLLASNPFLYVF